MVRREHRRREHRTAKFSSPSGEEGDGASPFPNYSRKLRNAERREMASNKPPFSPPETPIVSLCPLQCAQPRSESAIGGALVFRDIAAGTASKASCRISLPTVTCFQLHISGWNVEADRHFNGVKVSKKVAAGARIARKLDCPGVSPFEPPTNPRASKGHSHYANPSSQTIGA